MKQNIKYFLKISIFLSILFLPSNYLKLSNSESQNKDSSLRVLVIGDSFSLHYPRILRAELKKIYKTKEIILEHQHSPASTFKDMNKVIIDTTLDLKPKYLLFTLNHVHPGYQSSPQWISLDKIRDLPEEKFKQEIKNFHSTKIYTKELMSEYIAFIKYCQIKNISIIFVSYPDEDIKYFQKKVTSTDNIDLENIHFFNTFYELSNTKSSVIKLYKSNLVHLRTRGSFELGKRLAWKIKNLEYQKFK